MNERYREIFDSVRASEYLKMEAINMKNLPQISVRQQRRVWPVLVAVILCAALTIGAAAAAYQTLGSWMREYGILVHSNSFEITEDQEGFIDHLTQPVNQSHTIDGVTMWIDSIAAGDDGVWLLLNVSGLDFEDQEYYFESWRTGSALPRFFHGDEEIRFASGGEIQHRIENGVFSKLYFLAADIPDGSSMADGTFTLKWDLSDISTLVNDEITIIKEGTWSFTIPLKQGNAVPVRTIDRLETVMELLGPDGFYEGVCVLENIRISCTGIKFRSNGNIDAYPDSVVLKDGSKVGCRFFGSGSFEINEWEYILRFDIPVNVENIVSMQLGENEILLT